MATTTAIPALPGYGLLKRRWLYHLLFWLTYFGLVMILYAGLREKMTLLSCFLYFLTMSFEAVFAYINLYLLIPRLLFEKRYMAYGLALFFLLLSCAVFLLFMQNVYEAIEHGTIKGLFKLRWAMLGAQFVIEVYVVGITAGAKFLKDYFLNQQWIKEKEKHYLETELKFLRSQIQPHFFFNTLNNIYSLTLKKSDEAPGIILKLSDLMSYMLYESNVPQVPLAKEISYLQNYLDVEQLRFGQRLSVSFTRSGFMDDVNIPPMILILFLENSFKHGVKNNINKIHIDISLNVDKHFLYFKVENPYTEHPSADTAHTNASDPIHAKGIGLKNVRRRLDLLFPDAYTLDIQVKDNIFIVSLKMPLC
ncbi:MAG: histidine kinase [Bacteroidetes bacterium]|nr:histidine kinase [Bacteroidota bacterium]